MSNTPETMTDPRSALPNVFTDISAREIDFVTRFARNWEALREILGIVRPIEKQAGTVLRSYTASITLESGEVPEGAIIPYSKATVVESLKKDLTLEKYAKAVTVEDVLKYGADVAVEKTDEAFLNELQDVVTGRFYASIADNVAAMTAAYDSFQMAVAMSIGMVKDKFKKMKKDVTKVVTWVNTLDAYEYLGAASLSIQTTFGIDYIENFMGATLILSSEIERGKVISTPSDNLVLYFANPASADFKKLGLVFTTDGETNLIGFHANGNYSTAVGESFALMGMVLWFEYADGMAIIDVDSNF